MQTFSSVEFS